MAAFEVMDTTFHAELERRVEAAQRDACQTAARRREYPGRPVRRAVTRREVAMDLLSRRRFLSGAAALGGLALSGRAGATPGVHCATGTPKVLEIFLKGGFLPWHSFWYDADQTDAAHEVQPNWSAFSSFSAASPPPVTAVAGLHDDVLGPVGFPLVGTSLVEKMRVCVMKHDLVPHEAAIPYAVTGTRMGRPELVGLATRVNAKYPSTPPLHAIVLDAGGADVAGWAASSNATFGPTYRPPVIRVNDGDLMANLARTGLSTNDGVENVLLTTFGARLVHPDLGARVRSDGFDAYGSAAVMVRQYADDLLALLSGTDIDQPAITSPTYTGDNPTRRAVKTAAQLLTGTDVEYVLVVDGGVLGTYDTHDNFSNVPRTRQAGNLWNLLTMLAELDADGLLDGVLVVLNTEFGRLQQDTLDPSPAEPNKVGTEHWPDGYVNVLMGAPFGEVHHRGDIDAGHVGVAGPLGNGPYGPEHVRAALAEYLDIPAADVVDTTSFTPADISEELIMGDTCGA